MTPKTCRIYAKEGKDTEIKVVDAPMGRGKTSAAINYINQSGDDKRFFFISPYLTEISRIRQSCPDKHFHEPLQFVTKLNGLKSLLKQGRNIVTTHALFDYLDAEACAFIRDQGYTLIMDEVHGVVDKYYISKADADTILDRFVETDKDGTMKWVVSDYEGRFEDCRRLIETGQVCCPNGKTLIWTFPVQMFECFTDIIIMTYMFDVQIQKYYFDYFGITYTKLYVKGDNVNNYMLTEEPVEYPTNNYKNLIHICASRRLNAIGSPTYALSQSWYERNMGKDKGIAQLRKNIYTFFRSTAHAGSVSCLWTTFARFHKDVSGAGYAKSFLSCNARATNKWKDRWAVAYVINRFLDPNVKTFFSKKNIVIDEDGYALSEMIQFVWRSAIRDNKEIWLYIPSRRMRTLFKDWLEKGA